MLSPRHAPHPVLAITAGDPCGIGPEVILKALQTTRLPRPAECTSRDGRNVRIIVIGDWRVFRETAARLRLRAPTWSRVGQGAALPSARVSFVDADHRGAFRPGHSSAAAGLASLHYLKTALDLWRCGLVQGLVTAPVTKWAIQRALPSFEGHTEWLASRLPPSWPVMAFVSPHLRVILLTRHLALRDVSRAVTPRLVERAIRVVVDSLRRDFGVRRPRLAVCGLNPHAGEAGRFGNEERRILRPVLRRLSKEAVRLEGPFAADGFFATLGRTARATAAEEYDAVICWYHDQGLIPFKLLARDQGCQMTMGLPLVRTSPDHGSALDLAGRGVAHPGSMRYAITLASQLIAR